MEVKNILVFGYSPRHSELLFSLDEILTNKTITLVGPKIFLEQTISRYKNVFNFYPIELPKQTKEIHLFKRIYYKFIVWLKLRNVNPNLLITSNELAPASIILSKKKSCNQIIVLDEGDFDVIYAKESIMTRYKISKKFKEIFFGISDRFCDKRITHVVTDSLIAREIMPEKIIPIKQKGPTKFIDLGANGVIIITSPLSENGNSKYKNQEIEILNKLICANKNLNFYIRQHYRESKEKYNELYKYKNCCSLNESIDIPLSDIEIKGYNAIGFHSSALNSPGLIVTKKYSLSGLVDSKHSLAVVPSLAKKYEVLSDYNLTIPSSN